LRRTYLAEGRLAASAVVHDVQYGHLAGPRQRQVSRADLFAAQNRLLRLREAAADDQAFLRNWLFVHFVREVEVVFVFAQLFDVSFECLQLLLREEFKEEVVLSLAIHFFGVIISLHS